MARTPHLRRGPAPRSSHSPKRDYEFKTELTWQQYAASQFSKAGKILGAAAVFGGMVGIIIGYFDGTHPQVVPPTFLPAIVVEATPPRSLGAGEHLVSNEVDGKCLAYDPPTGRPVKACDLYGLCATVMAEDGHILVNPSCRGMIGVVGVKSIPGSTFNYSPVHAHDE